MSQPNQEARDREASQFDETTEKKAKRCGYLPEKGTGWGGLDGSNSTLNAFKAGRNSTKASMEILARALVNLEQCRGKRSDISDKYGWKHAMAELATEAIAQVKANGDWPLKGEK